jgi:hypothetical protein
MTPGQAAVCHQPCERRYLTWKSFLASRFVSAIPGKAEREKL